MFKWNSFSQSLLVRSVYLITIPIVLVQVIGIIIFFELHWDLVLKRSAQSITNEIKVLEMNRNSNSINKYSNALEIIKTNEFEIKETQSISNWIFRKRIEQSLSQIPGNFQALQDENFFIFFNKINSDYYYLVPKKE